jgi:predicted ATPase/GTPase SAR1 family protein
MDPTLFVAAHATLVQLHLLAADGSTTQEIADTALGWGMVIDDTLTFLENRRHDVVFIGSVGVGKSSLIAVLADLLVGGRPQDRAGLKGSSVLEIGAGRTTVCEICLRAPRAGDGGAVGLVLDPLSPQEMTREIEIFAQGEWARAQPEPRGRAEDDASQEVHRAIRAMTGYADYTQTVVEDGVKRRKMVRATHEAAARFSSHAEFARHLIERAALDARKTDHWWWDTATPETLKELKSVLRVVNQGADPEAMLPRQMSIVVPEPLPGSSTGLDVTLVDTRGLDDQIEARRDVQDHLRDRRAILVLCASFKDAPGDTMRAVLRSLSADAELRGLLPRSLLVLVDQGDAEQVNGADGDRETGQGLKVDECLLALESLSLPQPIERAQVVAFDTLNDDRERLLSVVDDRLRRLRGSREQDLVRQVDDAQEFLRTTDLGHALRESVDRSLREIVARHARSDAPLRDPMAAMYDAIRACHDATIVNAACRRNGAYTGLDLYAAVRTAASQASTAWLEGLIKAATSRLDELEKHDSFAQVREHVRLRRAQFVEGQVTVVHDYAARVAEQVEKLLKGDPVWGACRDEWGNGPGFKNRIIEHLTAWARRQDGLTDHEHVDASVIPFFAGVVRPPEAPRFTLHVHNLRALRHAHWSPQPVSVLIGANGSGKSTLLQVLRFLRIAYERDIADAVTIPLLGIGNLKSWGAAEQDPIRIRIDLGDASWQMEIAAREGSAEVTRERFMEGEREIFVKDNLGSFVRGTDRLDPSSLTGLRALVDRGVTEPSLGRMAAFVQRIAVYHHPDLPALRAQGSLTTDPRRIEARGGNVLAVLRRWHQERKDRHRYDFVVEGLGAAFPGMVSDLDFVEAGNTLVARVYRPGRDTPSPLDYEADGVLQLLVLFCQVAAAEVGSVLAIDEPENCLHPYAQGVFLRRTARWAAKHQVTVLLATHSTVLLDALTGHPEQVYVMKSKTGEEQSPTPLDQLCDPEWLASFKLGSLYEQGEIGSNEDEV